MIAVDCCAERNSSTKPDIASVYFLAGGPVAVPRASFPQVNFELCESLIDFGSMPVAPEMRDAVIRQCREAYNHALASVPMSFVGRHGRAAPLISSLQIGQGAKIEDMMTGSSVNAPGRVIVSAKWPTLHPYRLASLFVHEAVHQILYRDARQKTAFSVQSSAYSPWRFGLRPAIMVWHAYWTFAAQTAFLIEMLARDGGACRHDAGLAAFAAELHARVELCRESMQIFDILDKDESLRADAAISALVDLSALLPAEYGYGGLMERYAAQVQSDLEDWMQRATIHEHSA